MFKRLVRLFLGDPFENADLCDKCRISYTVADIIGPPLTFDELIKLLYHYGVLCSEPCGVTTPHLLPQQHSVSSELPSILQKYGISCQRCTTSFITLSILGQSDADVEHAIADLQRRSLICQHCLLAFLGKIDQISFDLVYATKGPDRVRSLICQKEVKGENHMKYKQLTALVNAAHEAGVICNNCHRSLYRNVETCACQERGFSMDSEWRCQASRIHGIERCDIVELKFKDAMKVLVTIAENKCFLCPPCFRELEAQSKSVFSMFKDIFR